MQLRQRAARRLRPRGLRLPARLLQRGGGRSCCGRRPRGSTQDARKSGARNPARRAPRSPPTPTTRPSAGSARHPRLIQPVEQLFGEPLYMHQFKINAKAPFDGELWQWHQDYGNWARDDGMPEPRAMNIAVFLDEVMAVNGPLMFIPRSHKARRARGRPRHDDDVLPPVDARQCDDHAAGGRRRHRGAHRQAGHRAHVPWQSRPRLAAQHDALPAQDRLSHALRGLQPHHQVHPAGVDRAPRLHADRGRRGRRAARTCPGEKAAA